MIGIYVHIPFCVQKCGYCDFYSVSDSDCQHKYFEALKKEIADFPAACADTVFFGGGTPSCVNAEYIAEITELLRNKFFIDTKAEITLEANPKTFDRKKLEIYKQCGINRLSIGLQSASDAQLKRLGRIHNLSDFEKSFNLARDCGFSNINIDVMYGLPMENKREIRYTLDMLAYFNPEHISAYALTLNENTPIYGMNYVYPYEDEIYENYMMICEALSDYRHYEISNFGRSICRHNMKYWSMEEYAGFGASASGFYGGIRYTHKKDLYSYIMNCNEKVMEEKLSGHDEIFEYIMLSLRTECGIDSEFLKNKYNFDIYKNNKKLIIKLTEEGLALPTKNGFRLTEKGFFVSNSIISSFNI